MCKNIVLRIQIHKENKTREINPSSPLMESKYVLLQVIYSNKKSHEDRNKTGNLTIDVSFLRFNKFVKFDEFDETLPVQTKWLDVGKVSLIPTYGYLWYKWHFFSCPQS